MHEERHPPDLVSVVVPVLNGGAVLGEQMEALSRQTYQGRWEVLLVDNGSTDDTVAVARSWAPRLPRLQVLHARPRGANVARNAGAAAAAGQLLVFCDADDRAVPGWLDALVRAAAAADIVAGDMDEEALNDPGVRTWRKGLPPNGTGQVNWFGYLPCAQTANLAVWASVWRSLDGFSSGYRRGCDEVSFSWRALRGGYQIAFAPDAVMSYRHRSTIPSLTRQFAGYGFMEAKVFREFRAAGMGRRRLRTAAFAWLVHARRAPMLFRSQADRARWMLQAGYLTGRAAGCIRFRVLYL